TPTNNVTADDDEASDEQPIMHSSKKEVQAFAEASFEPRKAEYSIISRHSNKREPTNLYIKQRLEKLLDTPARIYYQGVSPVGSDKPNIVVPRVWYYAQQGVKNFVTEIGVGPRGSSFAFACSLFGLNCISRWNCSIEDLNEYEAIICCFGENSKMKINSTKSMLGHLVGASGVVKAVATIKVTDKLYEWVDLSVL
ncbi:tryptophan synthase, partial [Tanacetum coccineum]